MSTRDLFGLSREHLIRRSGVRDVFTPHQPIHSEKFFFGREAQIQKIIEQINTPGQHALLYGDRGVGKSSLANVASEVLFKYMIRGGMYTKRCDSSTRFADVVEEPLRDAGFDPSLSETRETHKQGGRAGLKVPFADAGINSDRETSQTYRALPSDLSPSMVASRLAGGSGLLLVDEADAIAGTEEKRKLAELVKLLSDSGSGFKLLITGIAETGGELTGGHPSVGRCLKETKLERMKSDELALIVREGATKIRLQFDDEVIDAIVRLSAGYPHFTHLLALKCAEDAVAEKRNRVHLNDLQNAMRKAVEDAEGSLRRAYDDAARSSGTEMYTVILLAAAKAASKLGRTEFNSEALRREITAATGVAITQNSLNNYLRRLVSDTNESVLRRVSKGVYCFVDPRMPSFIRIANSRVD